MTITISGDDLEQLVDRDAGREVIKLLTALQPASALLTLSVVMSSILGTVCDNPGESCFTADELNRLVKDLVEKIHQGRADGTITNSLQ